MKTETKICEICEGTGKEKISCCGDEIGGTIYEDIGICPTCKEHSGGECYECNGSGIARSEHKIKFRANDGKQTADIEITTVSETENDAKKALSQYVSRKKWVVEEIYSIIKN